MSSQECDGNSFMMNANTLGVAAPRVFFFCLPLAKLSVKPFANIVADYARCDGKKECDDFVHDFTSSRSTGTKWQAALIL